MTDLAAVNRRRAILLVAAFVAGAAVIGLVIGLPVGAWAVGAAVAALVAMAIVVLAVTRGARLALAVSRADAADEHLHARLFNLVEGLRVSSGVPMPRLYVIDDEAPNALAVGSGPRNGHLAVTTGLLRMVDRVELEGVLAHELVRIRQRDILPGTMAAVMIGWPVLIAERLMRRRWWNGGREPLRTDPAERPAAAAGLGAAVLGAIAPVVAWTMRRAIGDDAVLRADVSACALTRYPPGLAAALEKLATVSTVTHGASAATAHLWLCQPLSGLGDAGRFAAAHRPFDVHPPLAERIDLLREL